MYIYCLMFTFSSTIKVFPKYGFHLVSLSSFHMPLYHLAAAVLFLVPNTDLGTQKAPSKYFLNE